MFGRIKSPSNGVLFMVSSAASNPSNAPAQVPPSPPEEGREILILRTACEARYKEGSENHRTLMGTAILIAGICITILIGSLIGILIGSALVVGAGKLLGKVYAKQRNRVYSEITQALDTPEFQRFVGGKNASIQNISQLYNDFKASQRPPAKT